MQRGLLRSLFDLSFTSFVITRAVKALYVLSFVPAAIMYVVVAVVLFTTGGGESASFAADGSIQTHGGGSTGLGMLWLLLLGPLFLLLHALIARLLSELVIVVFRIFENTRDQLAITRAAWSAAATARSAGGETPPRIPPV